VLALGRHSVYAYAGGEAFNDTTGVGSGVPIGRFVLLAATWDGTNSNVYVDGQFVQAAACGDTYASYSAGNILLAGKNAWDGSPGQSFHNNGRVAFDCAAWIASRGDCKASVLANDAVAIIAAVSLTWFEILGGRGRGGAAVTMAHRQSEARTRCRRCSGSGGSSAGAASRRPVSCTRG
jgi:hypothetical protein